MSSSRKGPPKHQNKFAWKPHGGVTINPTEVGGRFRPYSEITGVCYRCKEQIDWKRKYGKYKLLTEPAKCQRCTKRNVRQAYHNVCHGCAKEHKICAKCSCRVDNTIGRDISEVEAEKKTLDEAIKNARERDRRSLLRAMEKGKTNSASNQINDNESEAGELFTTPSFEEFAEFRRNQEEDDYSDEDEPQSVDSTVDCRSYI
ncbi:hypothetical protein ABFS83_11G111500 [Erythranthe nasuta]|uniref:uncharacterized protein C9orf85 homolog n=1 Tax=Erythranthe guttata TaxID=4155 RepID=UPI00064E018F|nr:PREDICTED: uncharacterized protein C9orf85 homolog [Erythranthe guttata]|eukprot:XP_012840570.1 PREDICTED: uncharacterized protein C9orf85 homolog [Erythranthe guttata]